ncbi:Uncharacterised protein [Candidatus Anstonella stagnisolia]|nr:Uncharacterised protein [Candidatus Anstonella stagnisolia]
MAPRTPARISHSHLPIAEAIYAGSLPEGFSPPPNAPVDTSGFYDPAITLPDGSILMRGEIAGPDGSSSPPLVVRPPQNEVKNERRVYTPAIELPGGYMLLREGERDEQGHYSPPIILKTPRQDSLGRFWHNCFLIGAITNVPKTEFSTHLRVMSAMGRLLQFRYELNFSTALLDTDSKLTKSLKDPEHACYHFDIRSVDWSNFLVGEFSFPSLGAGLEAQRASEKGIPIIGAARMNMFESIIFFTCHKILKREVPKFLVKKYVPEKRDVALLRGDGSITIKDIYLGDSNVSPMLLGNPALIDMVFYTVHSKWLRNMLYNIEARAFFVEKRASRKMQEALSAGKAKVPLFYRLQHKLAKGLRHFLENNDPISKMLADLDARLISHFHLVPRTAKLAGEKAALEARLNAKDDPALQAEVAALEKKIHLLDDLLLFRHRNPIALFKKYQKTFPEAAERDPMFGEGKEQSLLMCPVKDLTKEDLKLVVRPNGNGKNGNGKKPANGAPHVSGEQQPLPFRATNAA